MSSTTTPQAIAESSTRWSECATRKPVSRPVTPLRPSSRSTLRDSSRVGRRGSSETPLEVFEPTLAELSDSMADLEANFMHLQLMHESLARFSDNFASFLYGLNMNAFCVDFPEAPIPDSFQRVDQDDGHLRRSTTSDRVHGDIDGETTFMTTDTSFVENPPPSSKAPPNIPTPLPASRLPNPPDRGGIGSRAEGAVSRGGRGARGSGLARVAKGRGIR